jgi:hypothetical protein
MNLLLIVLIIVLLFYVCRCAKEQFDNSLYLGYGGEPQFRDMTEDYGQLPPPTRRQARRKFDTWRDCKKHKGISWCLDYWL